MYTICHVCLYVTIAVCDNGLSKFQIASYGIPDISFKKINTVRIRSSHNISDLGYISALAI